MDYGLSFTPQDYSKALMQIGENFGNAYQRHRLGSALSSLGPDATWEDRAKAVMQINPTLGVKLLEEGESSRFKQQGLDESRRRTDAYVAGHNATAQPGTPKPPVGYYWKDETNPQAGLIPYEGGPSTKLPAETAARIGMIRSFQGQYDGIRKQLENGELSGPVNAAKGAAGMGEPGNLRRKIDSGSEALLRSLTGAGMNKDEAAQYVRRYQFSVTDTPQTQVEKLDQLNRELTYINESVTIGRDPLAGHSNAGQEVPVQKVQTVPIGPAGESDTPTLDANPEFQADMAAGKYSTAPRVGTPDDVAKLKKALAEHPEQKDAIVGAFDRYMGKRVLLTSTLTGAAKVDDWDSYFSGKPAAVASPKQDWDSYFGEAAPERSLGGFLDNVGTNAADIGSGVASGISNFLADPKGAITSVLNTPPGDALDFIGDTIRHTGGDLGFKFNPDKTVGWSKEKLAKNVYERPIDVGLSASMVTPAAVNPLRLTAKGASKAVVTPAAKVAKYSLGETTGMGPHAIAEAYRSGKVGGEQGKAFREGMRGELDPDTPVDIARGAVGELKADRKAEYLQGKEKWKDNPMSPMTQRLAWDPIEAAYESTMGIKRYRGKDLKPSVASARDKVRATLDEWKADPGSWTPEGFDALKQRLQDLQQSLDPMKEGAARAMVGAVTHAIKRQISRQAPSYAKSMKAYEEASRTIDEVVKSLSLGSKASHDTALRKLQSVLRNNALTNWGARAKLADLLAKKAPELMPMLSGMAANTWTPRGLAGKLVGSGGVGAAGLASGLNLAAVPAIAGAAAAASPRIVGEAAHGLGRAKGAIDQLGHVSPMLAYLLSLGQDQ